MGLQSIMDSHLVSLGDYEPREGERKFYLSDMGKCMRVRYLKRLGVRQTFDPHVNWILKIGEMYHNYVYDVLEAKGVLVESEADVETEHFKGRYDGIVRVETGDNVLDIKSAGFWKFSKALKGEEDTEYVSQLLSYVMLLQDEGKKVSNQASILYVNKEPSDKCPHVFHEHTVNFTKRRADLLREEMDTLTEYWQKSKIPPCTCPGWMRNYNAFQPLCSASELDIKKWLKLMEKGQQLLTSKKQLFVLEEGTPKLLRTVV